MTPSRQVVVKTEKGHDRCTVTSPPVVRFDGGGVAIWRFENACDHPHTLKVAHFKVKGQDQLEWPFDKPGPHETCSADSGRHGLIQLKILSKGQMKQKHGVDRQGTWTYEYEMELDGQSADPEIIIDWPRV
jgi:hypothetical protein